VDTQGSGDDLGGGSFQLTGSPQRKVSWKSKPPAARVAKPH